MIIDNKDNEWRTNPYSWVGIKDLKFLKKIK